MKIVGAILLFTLGLTLGFFGSRPDQKSVAADLAPKADSAAAKPAAAAETPPAAATQIAGEATPAEETNSERSSAPPVSNSSAAQALSRLNFTEIQAACRLASKQWVEAHIDSKFKYPKGKTEEAAHAKRVFRLLEDAVRRSAWWKAEFAPALGGKPEPLTLFVNFYDSKGAPGGANPLNTIESEERLCWIFFAFIERHPGLEYTSSSSCLSAIGTRNGRHYLSLSTYDDPGFAPKLTYLAANLPGEGNSAPTWIMPANSEEWVSLPPVQWRPSTEAEADRLQEQVKSN